MTLWLFWNDMSTPYLSKNIHVPFTHSPNRRREVFRPWKKWSTPFPTYIFDVYISQLVLKNPL